MIYTGTMNIICNDYHCILMHFAQLCQTISKFQTIKCGTVLSSQTNLRPYLTLIQFLYQARSYLLNNFLAMSFCL